MKRLLCIGVLGGAVLTFLVFALTGCSRAPEKLPGTVEVKQLHAEPGTGAVVRPEDTIYVQAFFGLQGVAPGVGSARWGRMVFKYAGGGCDHHVVYIINHREVPPPMDKAVLEFRESGSNFYSSSGFYAACERIEAVKLQFIGLTEKLDEALIAETNWFPLDWRLVRGSAESHDSVP